MQCWWHQKNNNEENMRNWVATVIIEGKRRCWEAMLLTSTYSLFTYLSSVWKVTSSYQFNKLKTTIQLLIYCWKCNPCSLIRGPWNISNYLHFTVGFTVKDLKMMISNDVVRLSKPLGWNRDQTKKKQFFQTRILNSPAPSSFKTKRCSTQWSCIRQVTQDFIKMYQYKISLVKC